MIFTASEYIVFNSKIDFAPWIARLSGRKQCKFAHKFEFYIHILIHNKIGWMLFDYDSWVRLRMI